MTQIAMAGITNFVAGEEAIAGNVYWSLDDRLSFNLELTDRNGGHHESETVAMDYGSDISIDPGIETGDRVKFIKLSAYSGLWIMAGTELDLSKVEAAITRVKVNRSLSDSRD